MGSTLFQVALNGIATGAAYSLIALGFAVIYRVAGFLHFAHGAIYCWSAYMVYALYVVLGYPLLVALAGSVIVSAILGSVLDVWLHRGLRARGATPLVLLLASIGVFTSMQNMIPMVFGDATRTLRRGSVDVGLSIVGARMSAPQLATIGVAAALYAVLWFLIQRTRIGLDYRAVAADRELAEISGVSSRRITTLAFGVGSALAAVAAGLAALDVDITPVMGMPALLVAIVAIVLGGTESLLGAALGGLTVGLLQNAAGLIVGARWQDSAVYVLLLGGLLFRPLGLFGRSYTRLSGRS